MSDIFKLKKSRDSSGSKNKVGTLDSIHETYIEDLQEKNTHKNIQRLKEEIRIKEEELNNRKFNLFEPTILS